MKNFLMWCVLCLATVAMGAVKKATWSTQPSQPIYVGQTYNFCLTLETDVNEEIASFNLGTISQLPTTCASAFTKITSHTSKIVNRRRITKLFFQPLVATEEGTFIIPEMRPTVTLTQRIQQGFFTMSNTQSSTLTLPTYAFVVERMSEEAEGLPIGQYRMKIEADPSKVTVGGVVEILLTCTAIEGTIPTDYTFEFKHLDGCKLYPLQTVERNDKVYVASAYCVSDSTTAFTIEVEPLRYFDTKYRKVMDASPKPFICESEPLKEISNEIILPSGEHVRPIRYAPAQTAPLVGYLPLDIDEATLSPIEHQGAWMLIDYKGQKGWYLIDSKLKGEKK